MNITWIHYGIAFLAILLHILTKLESKRKGGNNIMFSVFVTNNWINVVISIISTVVLFLVLDDLIVIANPPNAVVTWGSKILAFMIGWFNYSFLRHIIGMFKKQSGMG